MQRSVFSLFCSEWFGISISTLALAQLYILLSQEFHLEFLGLIAEFLSISGISIFLLVLVLWISRSITLRDGTFSHWNNMTRLSFTALIPIIGFVGNYQLIYFFGLSGTTAYFSTVNFYAEYVLALGLGVTLGYRLYTKEIDPKEISYAIVIPPLAIGTGVFLAGTLMKYYGGVEEQAMYFLVLMGLGIFFFLFVFIGSLALAGHVSTKVHETMPTTMLPVGIASLIIINLFSLSGFGKVDELFIGLQSVEWVSVLLWGFEVWNFLVVMILMLTRPVKGTLGAWAYGFPLGLFATSTVRILAVTHFTPLLWVFVAIAVIFNILWVYAWINTGIFIRRSISS